MWVKSHTGTAIPITITVGELLPHPNTRQLSRRKILERFRSRVFSGAARVAEQFNAPAGAPGTR